MLIFLGCYLHIAYTILEFISYNTSVVDVCIVSAWMNGLGLSLPLIMATVLVKMLQVYRIFTLMKRMKPSVYTKYVAPVIYVLLILSPCLVILTLWTVIDPPHLAMTYVEHPGFVELFKQRRVVWELNRASHIRLVMPRVHSPVWPLYVLLLNKKDSTLSIQRHKESKSVHLLHLHYRRNMFWILASP